MKKLSRKTRLILTGLALLVSIIGTTYAWWVIRIDVTQEISMGDLLIKADFPELEVGDFYEPGTSVENQGTIENQGSIPAIMKIENESKIKRRYADDNLTPISESEQKFMEDSENMINLTIKPSSGLYDDPNNNEVFWFTDQSNNIYLLLDPQGKVSVDNIAKISGDMSNKYQKSTIKINARIKSTQVIDGAIQKEFGISSNDLSALKDEKIISNSSVDTNRAQKRLQELINR